MTSSYIEQRGVMLTLNKGEPKYSGTKLLIQLHRSLFQTIRKE